MDATTLAGRFGKFDWKWLGVSYCFFVVYHLLPIYLLTGFASGGIGRSWASGLWLVIGLFLIGVYIGRRSRGVTILEPAIGAALYAITLFLAFQRFWPRTFAVKSVAIAFAWLGSAFVVACAGAWLGEFLQMRKESKANQAQPQAS